jgi:hypothetical protein
MLIKKSSIFKTIQAKYNYTFINFIDNIALQILCK